MKNIVVESSKSGMPTTFASVMFMLQELHSVQQELLHVGNVMCVVIDKLLLSSTVTVLRKIL